MSGKVYVYMAFLFLNAATAFFIAWLLHIRLSSLEITAVVNGWDLDEKAAACRNAGLMYLVIALGLSARLAYRQFSAPATEPRRYDTELMDIRETVPLLCSSPLCLLEPLAQGEGFSYHSSSYGS